MIDSAKYKGKKIEEIKAKINQQPLYGELFKMLEFTIEEDFMQAELLMDQIVIGENYVKIQEPTVEILDFFKKKNYILHTLLPAYESENYKNSILAWLVKN